MRGQVQGSACLCVELNAVIVLCKKAHTVNKVGFSLGRKRTVRRLFCGT